MQSVSNVLKTMKMINVSEMMKMTDISDVLFQNFLYSKIVSLMKTIVFNLSSYLIHTIIY